MNLQKKYTLPFLVIAIAATLGSCASNPTANNISQTPAPTATPDIVAVTPTPSETPSVTSPAPVEETPEVTSTLTPSPSITKSPQKSTVRENLPRNAISYNAIPSRSQTPTGKTVDVTVYNSDAQCQELVPQKTAVPAEEPVAGAVGKILEGRDSGDFSLSGYRVNVKDGIATVDLRLDPNSKRFLSSLSSCEQFALFGSLRKTLISNNQWKIKDVRFTEKGEEVAL